MRAFDRRSVIAALGAGGLLGAGMPAAAQRVVTPRATEGPFYPDRLPLDDDNDLTVVSGAGGRAKGRLFDLSGRVLDRAGRPLPGARIEIWQCDANGVYLHSADSGRGGYDRNFQGFGRTAAADGGAYRFRTIVPVPYTGRTPHVHFRVVAPDGQELVTQMYISGHPRNERDFLFSRLDGPAARRAASVDLAPAPGQGPDAVSGVFDIVLG